MRLRRQPPNARARRAPGDRWPAGRPGRRMPSPRNRCRRSSCPRRSCSSCSPRRSPHSAARSAAQPPPTCRWHDRRATPGWPGAPPNWRWPSAPLERATAGRHAVAAGVAGSRRWRPRRSRRCGFRTGRLDAGRTAARRSGWPRRAATTRLPSSTRSCSATCCAPATRPPPWRCSTASPRPDQALPEARLAAAVLASAAGLNERAASEARAAAAARPDDEATAVTAARYLRGCAERARPRRSRCSPTFLARQPEGDRGALLPTPVCWPATASAEEAQSQMELALREEPDSPAILFSLAQIAYQTQQLPVAEDYLRRYLALPRRHPARQRPRAAVPGPDRRRPRPPRRRDRLAGAGHPRRAAAAGSGAPRAAAGQDRPHRRGARAAAQHQRRDQPRTQSADQRRGAAAARGRPIRRGLRRARQGARTAAEQSRPALRPRAWRPRRSTASR